MGKISPGGTSLIAKAAGGLGLAEGSRVLEIGCGEADTLARIAADSGAACTGLDLSETLIARGRAKHPDLDLETVSPGGLAEAALRGGTFDLVVLECVLSVSGDMQGLLGVCADALAKGGHLIVTDLCGRATVRELAADPQGAARILGSIPTKRVPRDAAGRRITSQSGPVYETEEGSLPALLIAAGAGTEHSLPLSVEAVEDRTMELDSFAAEKILEYGTLGAYFNATVPDDDDAACFFPLPDGEAPPPLLPDKPGHRLAAPGYYLAVLRKE